MTGRADDDNTIKKIDAIIYCTPIDLEELVENYHIADLVAVEYYDNFCHIRIGAEGHDLLKNSNYVLQMLMDLHRLRFGELVLDTSKNSAGLGGAFPPALRHDSSQRNIDDYYIIQFKGPIKNEWFDVLERTGAIMLDTPVDYYAHIVRIPRDRVDDVKSLEFISFVDYYHPGERLRGGLELGADDLLRSDRPMDVEMIFFKIITEQGFLEQLKKVQELGGRIIQQELDNDWWYSVQVTVPGTRIGAVAGLDGVNYIHPVGKPQVRNDNADWVIQSFDTIGKSTPIWAAGLHGEGIVVGMADTGIDYDHMVFRHNSTSTGVPGMAHRKVIRYNTKWDDYDYEGNVDSGHGTHTSASIVGDSLTNSGAYDVYDGMAYAAKIAFYDIVKENNNWDNQYISVYFDDAYAVGARTHSDSWGDDTTSYTPRAERCDQYQYDHYDFLIFIAPGNTGKILEPATAKNVVGVGNGINGNSNGIAGGSGKGPTLEGLTSPTIVTPGASIKSADSDGLKSSFNDGYLFMSGTSMSTPIAAGACALVEQYFRDGFYPSGVKSPGDGFMPSGPLKKAVLANSGADMFGGQNVDGHIIDNSQGWGKIRLDDALYLSGDTRELWIDDRYNLTHGKGELETGEYAEYMLNVNATEPLEITFAWNDYPGAGLKNDLDLIVTAPDSKQYLGNVYSNGESTTGGTKDSKNPIESVYFNSPVAGYYQVRIYASNIAAGGGQNFAIAATGEFNTEGMGAVILNTSKFGENDLIGITVLDSNKVMAGTVEVSVESTIEAGGETVVLGEDSHLKGKFTGSILVKSGDPKRDGMIQCGESDTVTITYIDTEPLFISTANAVVDMKKPQITGLAVVKVDTESFVVRWKTDESATTEVRYGLSADKLDRLVESSDLVYEHIIEIKGLKAETAYYFDIASGDDMDNLMVDSNGGAHYSAITASYRLAPDPYMVGWVQEGSNHNHLDDGRIYSGVKSNLLYTGLIQFNLSGLPDNLLVHSANLFMFGNNGSTLASGGGNWFVEVLNADADALFKGSNTSPLFQQVKTVDAVTGLLPTPYSIKPANVLENCWQAFEFNLSGRTELEKRISNELRLTVRINGPNAKNSIDNLYSWDTGYNISGGSRGSAFKPILVIWAAKTPRIADEAPSSITMAEDSTEDSRLNLSNIFVSSMPLEYTIPSHYDNYGVQLDGKNLDVEIQKNNTLKIVPGQNWNGHEKVVVNGSIMGQAHGGVSDPEYNIRNYVLYELDVIVIPVNDPPRMTTFANIPAQQMMQFTLDQDVQFRAVVNFSDPDLQFEGDSYKFYSNDSLITFESTGVSILAFRAGNDHVGTHYVELTIRDAAGATDSLTCIFNINNINDLPEPIISTPSDQSYHNTTVPVLFNGSASFDPDQRFGDILSFEWLSDREGQIGTKSVLSKYLKLNGTHRITLRVIDSHSAFNAVAVTIYVNKTQGFMEDDIDGDGIPNDWELEHGLDPYEILDRDEDPDNDRLTNYGEYLYNTDPFDDDTDNDDYSDADEVDHGTDPTDPDSNPSKLSKGPGLMVSILIVAFISIAVAGTALAIIKYRKLTGAIEDSETATEPAVEVKIKKLERTGSPRTPKRVQQPSRGKISRATEPKPGPPKRNNESDEFDE